MFSIKVKARPIKGRSKEVRLELVFFKTGFPRVPKVFNIIGEAKRWDSASQLFKGNNSLIAQKNELILKEKKKYLLINIIIFSMIAYVNSTQKHNTKTQ